MVMECINWIGKGFPLDRRKKQTNYNAFRNEDLDFTINVDDHVLIRNCDSGQPESIEFCFIAHVKRLFENDSDSQEDMDEIVYFAEVQWYSRIMDIRENHQHLLIDPDYSQELLQDHRLIDNIIDVETIFGKCSVIFLDHNLDGSLICELTDPNGYPTFFCRWIYSGIANFRPVKEINQHSGKGKAVKSASFKKSTAKQRDVKFLNDSGDEHSSKTKKNTIAKNQSVKSESKKPKRTKNIETKSLSSKSKDSENSSRTKRALRRISDITDEVDFINELLSEDELSEENYAPVKLKDKSKETLSDKSLKAKRSQTPSKGTPTKLFYSPKKSLAVTPIKLILDNGRTRYTVTKSKYVFTEKEFLSSDEEDEPIVKKKKSAKKPPNNIKKTVKSKHAASPAKKKSSLSTSKKNLNIVPNYLPCRELEFDDIYCFIEGKLIEETGGCMYISGVPGTGKTATIKRVLTYLEQRTEADYIPAFKLVEVNAMNLTAPHQCYVQILKQLTGKSASADHALKSIQKMFTNSSEAVVMVVDELDLLWTKRQDVMYSLFDWPNMINSKLIVLAIANTMDLPERLMMNRVSSRLGLTRKTFHPYTHQQLQEIVRCSMEKDKIKYNADAMQLVSRKVAAVSGDARRALEIWKRAKELATSDGDSFDHCMVELSHVDKAFQEMFCAPKILAIRFASLYDKTLLQAIVAEFLRTGLEESTFGPVFNQFLDFCLVNDLKTLNPSEVSILLAQLHSLSILLVEHGKGDMLQRIRLNVSVDDVNYALRK